MKNNNEILIIANGNSNLNFEYGKIIDNFSNIARINNYETKQYATNIGTKTDIWFHGANQRVKPKNNIPNKIIVLVPSLILKKKQDNMAPIIKSRQNLEPNQYNLIDRVTIQKYETLISSARLTTGTSAILWSIENYKRVIIHGFDFFKISKTHYFDSKIKKWLLNNIFKPAKKHNLKKEMAYVNNLITQKKIHLLSNIIHSKIK